MAIVTVETGLENVDVNGAFIASSAGAYDNALCTTLRCTAHWGNWNPAFNGDVTDAYVGENIRSPFEEVNLGTMCTPPTDMGIGIDIMGWVQAGDSPIRAFAPNLHTYSDGANGQTEPYAVLIKADGTWMPNLEMMYMCWTLSSPGLARRRLSQLDGPPAACGASLSMLPSKMNLPLAGITCARVAGCKLWFQDGTVWGMGVGDGMSVIGPATEYNDQHDYGADMTNNGLATFKDGMHKKVCKIETFWSAYTSDASYILHLSDERAKSSYPGMNFQAMADAALANNGGIPTQVSPIADPP